MKPEAQRIAIYIAVHGNSYDGKAHEVPNYLNDLNAMNEAEKVTCPERPHDAPWVLYRLELLKLCGDALHHATAAYRAEAFLRTIGKWQEEPVDAKV